MYHLFDTFKNEILNSLYIQIIVASIDSFYVEKNP